VEGVERLLLTQALAMTGAGRAVLVLGEGETLVEALRSEGGPAFQAPRAASIHDHEDLPRSIVRHVARTGEGVILEHAAAEGPFRSDPYVLHTRTRSVLCVPLRRSTGHDGAPSTGALYLEDNAAAGAFSPEVHAELGILATQAAVSLENAGAHEAIVQKARAQEGELGQTHADLAGALLRVKDAQKRLLVQEKLATLGGLTAGIAHEIKNPLNFINNFAESSVSIADELSEVLGAQRNAIDPEVRAVLEELLGELRGNAAKIHEHGRRADDIVRSMLEHSRGGSVTSRAVDVNALLKEYVTLAYQGFRSQDPTFNTSIEPSYAQGLAPLSLVPQDMGRVFLNLVNNACYAVHAKKRALGRAFSPLLKIATRDLGHAVQIRIRDNGTGIPAAVRERIFQPFFTTKPTGDGTGLGLSISHDIVQERGGTLEVETEEGAFTEFVITLPKQIPLPDKP
jgi:signal transduction histidine kinase